MNRWLVALLFALPALAQDPEETVFEVRGTVALPNGKPANAAVSVWDALAGDRPLAQGWTDEEGRFVLPVDRMAAARREHPFGPVSVIVHQPGWARQQVDTRPGGDRIEVKLRKPGVFEGTVTGEDGVPLPGAEVVAVQGRTRLATTTDEQGAFFFADLAPEPTTITADASGYRASTIEGGKYVFQLERLPLVAGRVVDASTKKTLEGVLIVSLGGTVRARTDEDGRFAIEHQGYDLALYRDGYAIRRVSFKEGDIELSPAEPVRGTVVDDKGETISFTEVVLDPGFGPLARVRADVAGAFLFEQGLASFGTVSVQRRGFLPERVIVDPNWRSDRVRVQLRRGRAVEALVLRDGDPAPGAEVRFFEELRPGASIEVARAYANMKGEVRLPALPARATLATAWGDGTRSPDVKVEAKMWLRLEVSPPVTGVVRDEAGKPVAGHVVSVEPPEVEPVKTAEDGTFSIDGLKMRTYRLKTQADGTWLGVEREVEPGQNVELVAPRNLGKGGVEITLAGKRSRDARVEMRGEGAARVVWAPPVLQPVRILGLAPGNYVLTIDTPGYQPFEAKYRVGEGVTHLTVKLPRAGTLHLKATPGARVFIQTVRGEPAPVVTTRLDEGEKEIPGFGPGRYRFLSRAKGEAIVVKEIEVGERDAPRALNLTGGAASTLAVRVVDADDNPVRGVAIELVTEGGFPFRTGKRTDANGEVLLKRLILGRIRVVAIKDGIRGETVLDIEPGKELAVTVRR